MVATHDRARAPGERKTIPAHLLPHKLRGLVASRQVCRAQATAVGLATVAVVERLLDHRPEDRLKVAHRVLGFATTVGPERLEHACARALHYDTPDYPSLKRILAAGLERAPLEPPPRAPPAHFAFTRQAGEFVAAPVGAVR